MKQIAASCLTVMLIVSLFTGNALAFSVAFTDYTGDVQFTGNTDDAYAVALIDADSQTILYQKNIDEKIEPASTTKILTLLIALEQGNLDDVVTIKADETYLTVHGSSLGIKKDEEIVFKDLINGMMMASGNDAAVAVADNMAGSVSAFSDMMNAKASAIGMTNSNFVTPHGMHNEDHYTTARDMATLTLYVLQNPQFVQIVGQKSYTMPPTNKHTSERVIDNTNYLLQPDSEYYYSDATGIKTGCTSAAGDCLVASASRQGMNLFCLIFNAGFEQPLRWTLAKDLFEWGFENFKTMDPAVLLEGVTPVQATVENAAVGDSDVLEFNTPEAGTTCVTLEKAVVDGILNGTDSIQAEAVYNTEPLKAPIARNDVLGTVTYKSVNTGKTIYQGRLIASRDVSKAGSESSANDTTTVAIMTPEPTDDIGQEEGDSAVWWWLLVPAGLVVFLVIYLLLLNKRKRRRFKHRQPHYSYKIRKR